MGSRLAALQRDYQAHLRRSAEPLVQLLKGWQADPQEGEAPLREFLHTLIGASGSYGFDDLCDRAARLKDAVVAAEPSAFALGQELARLMETAVPNRPLN